MSNKVKDKKPLRFQVQVASINNTRKRRLYSSKLRKVTKVKTLKSLKSSRKSNKKLMS